jgi:hypothetical protein
LGLHYSDFSTIFYEFYNIQHLHVGLEETVLRTGPQISQTGPRDKKIRLQLVPSTMAGGGSSIPARGRLGSARKGRGSAQGLTYDRFVAEVGVRVAPEAECGGGRRRLRWSFCSGELPAEARQRAARAALAGSRAATDSIGLRWSWLEEAAPRRRALAGSTACARGRTTAAFIEGRATRLQALAMKDCLLYSAVRRRPRQACSAGEQGTDR